MAKDYPTVLITIGDPTSSAPELAVRAAIEKVVRDRCCPVLIGSSSIIADAVHHINRSISIKEISEESLPILGISDPDTIYVLPWGDVSPDAYQKGVPSSTGGHHCVQVSQKAGLLALANRVDAICSAPSSKVSLRLGGYTYNGMTDVFLDVTSTRSCEMLLVLDRILLSLATTHVPLQSVSGLLSSNRILALAIALSKGLQDLFGIPRPRIGVAGLNPHAGEGGLFGSEETEIIIPAIRAARNQGLVVTGPIPADFVVPKIQTGELDSGIMLYHDQAHIPLKAIGRYKPATLLIGLPIIRTSVAHGTVYGKAKSGTADPSGMIHACLLAAAIASSRRKTANGQWPY